MDIQPINAGHLLVVPNRHAAFLADLDEETAGHLFRVAQRIAAALHRSGVRCEGATLFVADGEAAGQDVFHVHVHVIPRFQGDGFGVTLPSTGLKPGTGYFKKPERSQLDELARQIRRAP